MLYFVLGLTLMLGTLPAPLATSAEAARATEPEPVAPSVPPGLASLGFDASGWKALQRGDVVVSGGSRRDSGDEELRATGSVLVQAPAERAYALVADHARQPEYSRCTKEVEVLSNEGIEGARRLVRTRETHKSLWITMRYSLEYVEDPEERQIRWRLDPAVRNDVEDNRGSWRIVGVGAGRSVVVYEVAGLPGKLPRFLIDYFVRRDLPRFLRALRTLIEAEAP